MDEKQIKIRKDITGEKFGRLAVLKRGKDIIEPSGRHKVTWECQCDCGNIVTVRGELLRNGSTQSCGCLFREVISQKRKENKYDLSRGFGIGYLEEEKEFWFDLEDYEKIKDYYWSENHDGYIVTARKNKLIFLHRLIMNNPEGLVVDHIGGNTTIYDNRKCNLRVATISQNVFNTKLYPRNTSGVSGVWWDKGCQKWRSCIIFNNQRIYLGNYINKEDAIKARREAENKYFGDFSFCNSQKIYESINGLEV